MPRVGLLGGSVQGQHLDSMILVGPFQIIVFHVPGRCLCSVPQQEQAEMQNDAGEFVDLYVPRKCSASNRIIGAKDHASIQINISEVDKVTGRVNGQFKTYAICGPIRRMGESDDSILRLAKNDGIVSKNF
uniref:Small ribosomal subunit protein eS21 n=1 Tax=Zonotrichia albicollis TaxID=44394 RepID=A0A8D2MUZ7_ZONAL